MNESHFVEPVIQKLVKVLEIKNIIIIWRLVVCLILHNDRNENNFGRILFLLDIDNYENDLNSNGDYVAEENDLRILGSGQAKRKELKRLSRLSL